MIHISKFISSFPRSKTLTVSQKYYMLTFAELCYKLSMEYFGGPHGPKCFSEGDTPFFRIAEKGVYFQPLS